jgi:5-methylcytosine-specific restriction protein B
MNLAHVERYFADVLSGVESGERIIPDLAQVDGEWRPLSQEKLPFPNNLFVVGTVNIDETTYMFSPKVLDRANTLEFRVRTEDLDGEVTALSAVTRGDERLLARFLADATNPELGDGWAHRAEMAAALTELHSILSSIDREFGHRVFQEALRFGFLLDLAGDSDWVTALDYQVMQKVLPRFHGSVKQIAEPLRLLGSWCFHGIGTEPSADFDPVSSPDGEPELPVSFDKIARMYRRVMADHFVSFAE